MNFLIVFFSILGSVSAFLNYTMSTAYDANMVVSKLPQWSSGYIFILHLIEYSFMYGIISQNTALYHSENTYCDPASYLTRTYKGVLAGFVPTYKIYDKAHDTNGYIGYTASQNTIYVAFRGSESIRNWADNIDAVTVSYPLCSGCEVHKGFYDAEQGSIANVISQVKELKSKFPSYSVVVTGHSLGTSKYVLFE
jgi:hypothetical protein